MKFSKEVVQETGTILAFTCEKESKSPIVLYTLELFFVCLLFATGIFMFFIISASILILLLSDKKQVVKETLYVMKGLGLQITKISKDGSCSNLFIDNSEIREVVIKESMTPYDVRINIGIILLKSPKLVIPFNDFDISLKEAKQIYQET